MPSNKYIKIKDIKLDLKNYRTIPQKNEINAINAMISIKSERFYAIVESLINNGYLPTENLIILDDNGLTVKEGNRRTAALKLIHGVYPLNNFNIPVSLQNKIRSISKDWKTENEEIPCSIFLINEKDKVDKIVNLTHAKGEKASRDPWTSVAKARQNRNEKKAIENGLDLLEKYIEHGRNLTTQQKERWSGDYPITVLDEAIRVISQRLEFNSITDLVKAYPNITQRLDLEEMLRDIGLQVFGSREIREKSIDFAAAYNIPVSTTNAQSTVSHNNKTESDSKSYSSEGNESSRTSQQQTKSNNITSSIDNTTIHPSKLKVNKSKAYSIHDQRTVSQTLRRFMPKGSNRQKLVTLREELKKLKVKDNPIAFCFLLRSMFEISSNIYSDENSIPKSKTKNGKTIKNTLNQQLNKVTFHLTRNNTNKGMIKTLHGASSELSKSTGLLSVTSMNQLVHNNSFSIAPHDIFTLFNNVYPLLEAMN